MNELSANIRPDQQAISRYLFDTRGYVHHAGHLSSERTAALREELDAHWPDGRASATRRIRDLSGTGPTCAQLAADLADSLTITRYLNQPFRLIESYGLRRGRGSTQDLHNGFSERLVQHRDHPNRTMWRHHTCNDGRLYCMMVKVLVYLTDIVVLEDAPFCLIEGSHKANFEFPWPELDTGETADLLKLPSLQLVYPSAGDVIVLNEALMHGTCGKSSAEERVVLAYSYAPSFVSNYHESETVDPTDIRSSYFYG